MSVKFFGQFLLERGAVTRAGLVEAIRFQESRNKPLGEYAVQRGYLTEAHSETILRCQLTTDRRFGEIAVEKGLLSSEQLDELLTMQRNDHVLIGEALLECGAIDETALGRELEAFELDQAGHIVDDVIFPAGTSDGALLAVPVDLTAKLLRRLMGLQAKIGEGERETRPPVERLVSVTTTFNGALDAAYTLSVCRDVANVITKRMSGMAVGNGEGDEEMLVDSVKEFCNVVCGNTAARYAQLGRGVEILPPTAGAPKPADSAGFVLFPLHLAEGAVEVRISR